MTKFVNNVVEKIDENYNKGEYELVDSLNKKYFDEALIKNANIIIVGTLTPANGMNNGYYYSSDRNRVYGLIDYCFDTEDNGLANLKRQLKLPLQKEEILRQIKDNLFEHKIAFLDIINQAVRKKGSSLDDDITQYTLDFESFAYCDNNQKFVCTSKNAKIGLERINKFDNVVICPQDRFRCKKEDWKKELTNLKWYVIASHKKAKNKF